MKLTTKIVSIFLLGILLLTLFHGYISVRRDDARLKQEMEQEARSIAMAMEETLVIRWREQGQEGIAAFVRHADALHQHLDIRWITINSDSNPMAEPSADLPIDTSLPTQQLRNAVPGNVLSLSSRSHQRGYYPIQVTSSRTGCIEFSEPLTDMQRYRRGTMLQTATLLLGIVLCGGVVTLAGMRMVGQPLERLIAKTGRIGEGDFSEPLELNRHDELGQLADAINQMCAQLAEQKQRIEDESVARIAAVEQLWHADRLKTVGRLASGVAHELGTPLNVVSGRAELIHSGRLNDKQIHQSAATIKSESDRMAKIIRQLMDFARRRSTQRKIVNLGPIVIESLELLSPMAGKRNVTLALLGTDKPILAKVEAGQLQQAITNLIVNAIQAAPDGTGVQVSLGVEKTSPPSKSGRPDGAYGYVAVEDQGDGIPEENLQLLFEPFFTTKDVGEGTGLGLSVAHGIVLDHEGWIDVSNEPRQGSRFTLYLPLAQTKPEVDN